MTTERLYYRDSYLVDFRASVVDTAEEGRRVYLDRTAFYPASGGQPQDAGSIAGVSVAGVVDEGDRVAHLASAPVPRGEAACRVDWPRRFDHMQQHSGQHLLSAVLVEMFGAATVGFHLGAESSAIDVALGSLDPAQAAAIELRANELVFENRPLAISFEERPPDLRKPSEREGLLRIVSIEGLDRSACGGTHVRATGEIGPVLLRKLDKAHGSVRIEFLCGLRAIRRARADQDALARIARLFSAPPDETPALVSAQIQALDVSEKARRRLATELARLRGGELYRATTPNPSGLRSALQRLPKGAALDDELRATAQGFTAGDKAVFLAVVEEPPALLLAASKDAGLHAGDLLKSAVTRHGGRGGGNAQLAQGSLPSRDALELAVKQLMP
jgi:alanyl-tRNA synthetase